MLRKTMVGVQVDLAGGHQYPPGSTTKKGSKLISQTRKFICLVHSQSKGKIVATSMTTAKGSSTQQQQQRDAVMTEHRNNFSSPIGVPHKFQVGNKVWLHRQKERLTRTHPKLRPFQHGPVDASKIVAPTLGETTRSGP